MPYSQKYWQSLNLVVWPQTTHIGRFKLIGGMVRYRHTYMHMLEMSAGFNLAVERHTDKPPNFLAIWCIVAVWDQGSKPQVMGVSTAGIVTVITPCELQYTLSY